MKFISVDYQGDFAANGGRWYKERPCESFITNELGSTHIDRYVIQ
jgi:hypothetical protein